MKHFQSSLISSASFSGVQFVLNDNSPGVLARDLIQILLVVETPQNPGKAHEYLEKSWGIFYNHCLMEEELKLLRSSLKKLLSWTESERRWKEAEENPLRSFVSVYSWDTMDNLREIWSRWNAGFPGSKEEMLNGRMELLTSMGVLYKLESFAKRKCSGLLGKDSVHGLRGAVPHRAELEVLNYATLKFEEVESAEFVNPTLFERLDWEHSLDPYAIPFFGFHQSFFYKKDMLKKLGLDQKILDLLPVDDAEFRKRPLLSNSFQQFALMFISVRDVLERNIRVKFQFHLGDCLDFLTAHNAELRRKDEKVNNRRIIQW